jgi:predicted TIM-barrel fold metal-dependent hydrolase
MDREGVAAELIYHGDFRLGDLFHNNTNRKYPLEAWEAGARAWNRWAADTFGFATDRFLVTGAIGPCIDMAAAVAELHWIADHGFAATYLPGYMRHQDTPPLFDGHWDPFWAACAERGLAVVTHAGFGWQQGAVFGQLERILDDVAAAAGSTEREELFAHADAVAQESVQFFNDFLNSVLPRRPLWQLMLGGVFDRHPGLRLVLTEIRADWIPATLRYLDQVYAARRGDLPARRPPSDYWPTNCLVGASFIHKAEVDMRDEIGVETIAFGRDFPHPEGTWPHTREWLRDAFADVPEDEARAMLGENAIDFLGLDRDRLAEIARRIGPTFADVTGGGAVRPELIDSFAVRGGYLKPPEGAARIDIIDELIQEDVATLAGASR